MRILLHILLSSLELRRRGRLAHKHRHRGMHCCSSLFFAFFPRAQGGRAGQSPNQNLYLYLGVRLTVLKWFEVVPTKHRRRNVTTVFAYSHLNTPIDQ